MTQDSSPAPTFSLPSRGPLILGASGRIGSALRHLWQQGQWPGATAPLWQSRAVLPHHDGVVAGLDPMGLAKIAVTAIGVRTRGIIVLAGSDDENTLPFNTTAAEAALVLRHLGVAGPVLCLSTTAVYDPAASAVDDTTAPAPATAFGAAKLAMEQAMAPHAGVTCLRLAPVMGCTDLAKAQGGGIIGPQSLARALVALAAQDDLPPVMTIAQEGSRAALAAAAGLPADGPATAQVVACPALAARVPLDPATPQALVAEARAAGCRL